MITVISEQAIQRRVYWVEEIKKISGNFSDDFNRLERELSEEVIKYGTTALIDHLRLCGSIPESYGHDTSEEKLYSKYTPVFDTFSGIKNQLAYIQWNKQ